MSETISKSAIEEVHHVLQSVVEPPDAIALRLVGAFELMKNDSVRARRSILPFLTDKATGLTGYEALTMVIPAASAVISEQTQVMRARVQEELSKKLGTAVDLQSIPLPLNSLAANLSLEVRRLEQQRQVMDEEAKELLVQGLAVGLDLPVAVIQPWVVEMKSAGEDAGHLLSRKDVPTPKEVQSVLDRVIAVRPALTAAQFVKLETLNADWRKSLRRGRQL